MDNPIVPLLEALKTLEAAWDAATPSGGDERSMADAALLAIHEQLAAVRRRLDGLHTRIAADLASRSRPEHGKDGLARKAGFRSPAKLIAAATGGHVGDALRLIQVGEATRERSQLTGETAPPRHPHVAVAVHAGALSVAAASAITAMLDRVALRVAARVLDDAERTIVERAAHLSLDEVHAILRRAEAYLDPDGLEPAIEELHHQRSVKIARDAGGMVHLDAWLDPESAAPVVTAIEGIVTHTLRASRGHNLADGSTTTTLDGETRSLPQLRADALSAICRHAIACDQNALPGSATKVVVRMSLADLRAGTGVATVDGSDQPLDVATARRLAAAADIIPCVLGTHGEVLDLGRTARHFSAAQRLALVERDGGCASCHLPPAFTEAHHIRWWERHDGPTDLDNGVLLCTACHHRIHAEGWDIRIERPPGAPPRAGSVWFVPPAHVDPTRTPRAGGRRRFDPLAWDLIA